MSKNLISLAGREKIKKFLESTYIHYTATEIYEFFNEHNIESTKGEPFTKSTIRTYLKDLATQREIQKQDIPGKRDNYYIANMNEEPKYIEIELVGLWLQHYDDSKLLNCVKERLNNPNLQFSSVPFKNDVKYMYEVDYTEKSENILKDPESLKDIIFFQGVGMINYHDIPKIVGINPYRREREGTPPAGIQRPRQKIWIDELKKGLSKKYSAMLTNSILYFNLNDIEEIKPQMKREDGLFTWKIKIPFNEHVFDYDKTGIILDGQQRMWALDFLNLERTFIEGKESIPFYGSISVIIGDFGDNLDYELEVLRMYFITSNETKNLPPTLKQELAAQMDIEIYDVLPSKIKYKGSIDKMVALLDDDEISPYYHEIDHESKSFNKLGKIENTEDGVEIRFFSRKGLYDMVNTIIKGNPFNYDKKLEDLLNNMERWIDIIIDYFNGIKCVFYDDWNNKNSFIRRNIGINAIGMLIAIIWSHNLNSMDRDGRVKELIKYLARWKDFDENLDFSMNSKFNSKFQNDLKGYIKDTYDELQDSWNDSTMETEISEGMKEEIRLAEARWEKIKDEAEKLRDKKLLNIRKE